MANWQSTKYDFENEHWQEVVQQWVPELHMKVGAAISALKKSWAHYKIARRTGWADEVYELEHRINRIQRALGIEESDFGH
jgi:hypothetical protein